MNNQINSNSETGLQEEVNEAVSLFTNGSVTDGFYITENGQVEIFAVRSDKIAGLNVNWSYGKNSNYTYRGVILVSDGGATITSQEIPDINTPLP